MLRVNGKEVAARGSLLDACRDAGADVPAFCADPRLSRGGHCRSCMVEVEGRMVASCTTPARDGIAVTTESPRLTAYRRDLGELMASEASPGGTVGATLQDWGVDGSRYGGFGGGRKKDQTHPYIHLDLDACILCRRCVRACEEVQGAFVLGVDGRGGETRLAWKEGDFSSSGCVSCGACVVSCPTGALTDRDREKLQPGENGNVVKTTCSYCGVGCQLEVHTDGQRVQWIDGAAVPPNRQHLCVKGRYAHSFVDHPDRLRSPMIRRDGVLVPCSWEEALSAVVSAFRTAGTAVAGLSSSRCTNEENYLFQRWIRSFGHTNNIDCCARVCHAPSAAGMRAVLGTGAATNSLDDIERADLLMVVGSNATEAHPVTGARIRQAALRGTTLIVVDPRRTDLAAVADIHLQLRPGTNVPLFNSMASVLVEEGLLNRDFLDSRTQGWAAYEAFIRGQSPERWEPITGIPAAKVRTAARLYGTSPRPMMVHGLGVTEHFQGSEAVMLLCNLALLVGAIGRPGVGVNPLRGQNNVQGAADMGCQPDSFTGYQSVNDPAVRAKFATVWGKEPTGEAGLRLPQMYEAARAGTLKAMYIFGEDVIHSDPDPDAVAEALSKLDFLVVQEIFPSLTTAYAHVVLPGGSFLEKDGSFTNGERRVQRVRKILASPGEARADIDIFRALYRASGMPDPGDAAAVMEEIGSLWTAFSGIRQPRLDEVGLQWPVLGLDHPGTPTLHTQSFPVGKAELRCIEFAPSPNFGQPLTLTTGRVLEHYNTGSMTRRTPNDSLHPADLLEIHPEDAAVHALVEGQPVRIWNQHGEAYARARLTRRVAPGTLFLSFHHPESRTNHLLGEVHDRVSGCPEYKLVGVQIAGGPTTDPAPVT